MWYKFYTVHKPIASIKPMTEGVLLSSLRTMPSFSITTCFKYEWLTYLKQSWIAQEP